MGIINVTPDSFSDGGFNFASTAAIKHALQMVDAGVDIIDIGGESTRPGAQDVSDEQEFERVQPVLQALLDCGVPISVDTSKPYVMRQALLAGADMINDIYALRRPGAIAAVRDSDCGLCLMHMQGQPRTMQQQPQYNDVLAEVGAFLAARAQDLRSHGIDAERIVLDPGFGFGKTAEHNYTLLQNLAQLGGLDYPLLVGLSRKSMIGAVTGRPAQQRLGASIAAALVAVSRGARILRVHDVADTVDALKVWARSQGVRP